MERRTELAELHSPPSAFLRIMNFCTNCILSHLRSGPPRSDACATRLSWGGGAYPSGLAKIQPAVYCCGREGRPRAGGRTEKQELGFSMVASPSIPTFAACPCRRTQL